MPHIPYIRRIEKYAVNFKGYCAYRKQHIERSTTLESGIHVSDAVGFYHRHGDHANLRYDL